MRSISRNAIILLVLGILMAAQAAAQFTLPFISALSPNTAVAGGPAFTLTLTGSNFQATSQVIWNGSLTLPTTFFSSNQLSATVSANLIASPASVIVQVQNPDGARSGGAPFTITQPAISITTETLTAAVAGTAYTFTLSTAGGSAPFTWSLGSGALPAGLTLNSNGVITGTPTQAGTATFTVRVTDRLLATAQRTLQLTVNPPPFSLVTTSPLPAGTVGVAYSLQLAASGGVPPLRWSLTAPPPGLTLDTATGLLSGTPTANGTFTFTVQAADSSGLSASRTFSLLVNPPPLVITTNAVFSGTVGLAYSQTFAASGGIPPYRWSLLSGSLGSGLTFDAGAATITGTPQNAGSFTFTIQVTDGVGTTQSRQFTLTVETPRLNILNASPLPTGTVGTTYTQRLSAVGGAPPYTWSLTNGSVPGLGLDLAGNFSGTPTAAGTFNITITVRDSTTLTAAKAFSITINPGPLVLTTPRDLGSGVVGTAFSQSLVASGGVPPYTWSANGLPDGLSLDASTGVLSGAPTAPGTFSPAIRVTDALRATTVDLYRIVVGVPALPDFRLSGLTATISPATQPRIQLTMGAPFPVNLAGQLVLTFVPDSGGGDSTIQFSTGGRNVPFTIAANSTNVLLPVPDLALQTGTVAGSIRVTMQIAAGDVDVTPNPAPSFTARVERGAPVINRVVLTRSSSGLTVQITGFSTAREITQAVFQFSVASGSTLQTPQVTVAVESLFGAWFQDPASARFGSQFTFSQQFTLQGDPNAVSLQSVTLTNRVGASTGQP